MSADRKGSTIWVRPLVARVLKPDGQPLQAAGEPVERDNYWQRRINDRDVEIMTAAAIKKAMKAQGDDE